ncbi:MAG: NrsF family protein [Steroidobacteraceae bacterium]
MRNADIDDALERAVPSPHAVQPELLKRIAETIRLTLVPVRPLPSGWTLSAGLVLILAAVALVGAARVGFQGFAALGLVSRAAIFGTLVVLACAAAGAMVAEWIPGSRRRLTTAGLLALACAALLGVFALLFNDYRTQQFLAAGLSCLLTGLLHAAPAALLAWWLLRRGCALNAVSAGLAAGLLGGLTGVTLLELHCTNFEALHVLVWHTLVVPVSGAVGAVLGWALRDWG